MARPPKKIDEREAEAFAAAYLEAGANATKAMQRLNPDLTYASARTRASLLMKNAEVKAAVDRIREQFISTTILNYEQAQEILSSIARGVRSGGFPPSAAERIAAIKQLAVFKGWETSAETKPKNDLGTLIGRIRTSRGTILEAELVESPPGYAALADDGDAG